MAAGSVSIVMAWHGSNGGVMAHGGGYRNVQRGWWRHISESVAKHQRSAESDENGKSSSKYQRQRSGEALPAS
jgi:hypothetical protein